MSVARIDYDTYNPPSDLCDPIMSTLIEEPVKLPTSNIMMDFDVLKKHLQHDQQDPFNRKELTLEQVNKYNQQESIQLEVDKLKEKIE